jgi:hypothetical protein
VVVDEVVAIDRDRPELMGDRGIRAGAEPDPGASELGDVTAEQQGVERDRGGDDGLGHDAIAIACGAAAVVVVLAAHRAATGLTARTYPVEGNGSRCGSDQRAVMRKAWGRWPVVSSWPIGPYRC